MLLTLTILHLADFKENNSTNKYASVDSDKVIDHSRLELKPWEYVLLRPITKIETIENLLGP